MAEETDAFIREIEDDIREDKVKQIWKTYGNLIIVGSLALILGVAGIQGWKVYDKNQRDAAGERFAAAQDLAASGDNSRALTAFESIITDAGGGYAMLARFRKAGLLAADGNNAAAAAAFSNIAADEATPAEFRDLAVVLGAARELDLGDGTRDLIAKAKSIADGAGPWRFSAKEVVALDALRSGRNSEAKELFQALADDAAAPQGLKRRAREMLEIVGD